MSSPFTLKLYRWVGDVLSVQESTYETLEEAHTATMEASLPSSEAIAFAKVYNSAGELVHNAANVSRNYPTYA